MLKSVKIEYSNTNQKDRGKDNKVNLKKNQTKLFLNSLSLLYHLREFFWPIDRMQLKGGDENFNLR